MGSLQFDHPVTDRGIESAHALGWVQQDPLLKGRLSSIQEIPLFFGLTRAECATVASTASVRDFSDGQMVFRECQPASCIAVLISGRVKLTRFDNSGDQLLLKVFDAGQVIGTLGVIPGSAHRSNAHASGACRVLTWDARVFDNLCERIPALARNCLRISAERQGLLEERFFELITQHAEARLARLLVRLLEQSRCSVNKPARIEGLMQLEMSQMIGTTLWTVNRILCAWENLGLVEVQRGCVIVQTPKQLLAFAEKICARGGGTAART